MDMSQTRFPPAAPGWHRALLIGALPILFAVVATALVAAGVGGTAFAANTGHLPAPVQTWYCSQPAWGHRRGIRSCQS